MPSFLDLEIASLNLDKDTKFDMVVTSLVLMSNELSYYLAYRSNASLVLYSSYQASMSTMNWALGQPNNPAVIPSHMGSYS